MKQGGQGQMEGCQRCDGNRTDLRQGKCSGEEAVQDGLCQRSIGDLISNIKSAMKVLPRVYPSAYLED